MQRYIFLLTLTWVFAAETWAAPMTFAIVPQQSAKKLAKKWAPILNYLSKKSGHKLVFSTAKDIPTFEKRLAQGQYDFAYMNPYHFVVFNKSNGYQALVRQKNKKIRGILVVRKDSNITSPTQLNNTRLAFPAPAAFAASIIPRSELSKMGVTYTPKYVSSHDSVYINVAKGFFPAGVGVMRTFNNVSPEIRQQLRILWTSEGYTPHAIAAHPRISAKIQQDISQAILSMNQDPAALSLLKSINFKQLEPGRSEDWDDVRGLGIQSLAKPEL